MKRPVFHGRSALAYGITGLAFFLAAQSSVAADAVPGEYLVKLRQPSAANKSDLSKSLGSTVTQVIRDNLVLVQRSAIEKSISAIKLLESNPEVELVEPNYIYRASRLPNDTDFGKLWGLHNSGQADRAGSRGVEGVDIGAEKAWDITTGSKNVVVAVIDTGVDPRIGDLSENMWINEAEANGQRGVDDDGNGFIDDVHGYDFVNNDGDPTDDQGHGSHCAGTIGASGNDARGVVGVAWNVSLMGVKFLDRNGSGTLANAIRAIDYARQMGAHIMSNSWGGGGYSQILKDAIEATKDAGAVFVAAAGNSSGDNDTSPEYPASYDSENIISVAAIDNRGKLASFSCYGRTTVDVAAPGVNILSTIPGGQDIYSGTSMATPHVSGIAALLLSHEPHLTWREIKDRIVKTAKPLPALRGKMVSNGLADAYHALMNTLPPPDPNDPANWSGRKFEAVSSAHPYSNGAKEEFTLSVPGAKRIAIHFARFETERRYDKLDIFDAKGSLVGTLSGSQNDSFSPVIQGDTVNLQFTSDGSVNGYGYDIDFIAYE